MRIARASAPWRWGEGWLAQTVAAEPYCGKRLRFSGAVRANVCEAGAGAQLYIETRPKPPAGSIWTLPADNLAVIDRPIRSIHCMSRSPCDRWLEIRGGCRRAQ